MEKLWAPWRMRYLEQIDRPEGEECIFCSKPQQETDRDNLLLYRAEHAFVLMNLYPYNNGHLLIVPYRHSGDLVSFSAAELGECQQLLQHSMRVLNRAWQPQGFNIGLNQGRCSGAGIDQHLHYHIVPRWNGDTNFMPLFSETKVISHELAGTWDKLQPLFEELA
ncbi:HIT domain-containing protein [bacterium]|nr:HIT domain-containing protein [bacterium]